MKTVFTLKVHSVVDVITNSSSELFVGSGISKETVVLLVEKIYPDYLSEYDPIKSTAELTDSELRSYIYYHYNRWSNLMQTQMTDVIPGFEKEEMYELREGFNNRLEWNMKYPFITDDNRGRVVKGIDPNEVLFFMFSIDDNPNWDYQEQLMQVMDRYHLG